jgi:geranylgeranyl pyrophosphate synthase
MSRASAIAVDSQRAMLRPSMVVRRVLASAPLTGDLRRFLEEILERPGRILCSSGGPAIWPDSVQAVAAALGASADATAVAAAAVEFAVAAIDVADELIDDEWQGDNRSKARAMNGSVALSFLAQQCVAELAPLLGAQRAAHVGAVISEGSLACCAGQDLDTCLEGTDASDEQAHEMTVRKSGSLVAMAFRTAAAVACDDQDVIDAACVLGTHIGVIGQILNDLQDVGSDATRRKGDIRRGKRTLPIAYALHYAREEARHEAVAWLTGATPMSAEDEQVLVERMHDLGAQQYAWTVAQAHRHEALAALRALAQVTERPAVVRLRRLIPGVSR